MAHFMNASLPITDHGARQSSSSAKLGSAVPAAHRKRHSALVRVTHWTTTVAFLALLVSGGEIVLSHPRFYWGETGNVNMRPWLNLHLPSSRDTVPTGYGYVLPDQNGWSRYLHFRRHGLQSGRVCSTCCSASSQGISGEICFPRLLTFPLRSLAVRWFDICALSGRAREKCGRITCCSASRICS
jgi:Prokaryotic cytochrome b561